ncbi:hypothetical protein RPE78_00800 [Thioclava litoralis]|uniref:Uncharacterized protein n=1 Tax=Thioclava litoralis TaxID=3076557 RepID=A0ABZ1E063_9RHOB|nr:hypothetical protein RPE78_00800 [Thioclava sp. FTW29]
MTTDSGTKKFIVLQQASILAALVGVASVLWPAYEIAQNEFSWSSALSIILSTYAFLPAVVAFEIKVEKKGLDKPFARWVTFVIVASGAAGALFAILRLIGPFYLVVAVYLIALIVAYFFWPKQKVSTESTSP